VGVFIVVGHGRSSLPRCRRNGRWPGSNGETGDRTARAHVVSTEFLDQLLASADDAVTALYAGFARGNPLRRLLVGSKGRPEVVIAVHSGLHQYGGRAAGA
jgi:hypothetical protein